MIRKHWSKLWFFMPINRALLLLDLYISPFTVCDLLCVLSIFPYQYFIYFALILSLANSLFHQFRINVFINCLLALATVLTPLPGPQLTCISRKHVEMPLQASSHTSAVGANDLWLVRYRWTTIGRSPHLALPSTNSAPSSSAQFEALKKKARAKARLGWLTPSLLHFTL